MLQMSRGSMLALALFFAMALAAKTNAPSPSGVDTAASPAGCRAGKSTIVLPTGDGLGDKAAFAVYRDEPTVQDDLINANSERSMIFGAKRGASAWIAVGIEEQSIASHTVKSSCGKGRSYHHTSYRADRHAVGGRLPYTGPPADLMGKIATAGGLALTGGLFWWYGTIWPRRAPNGPIAIRRSPYGRHRHPGPRPQRLVTCPRDYASVMPVRARPPADSRTAAATAPDTSGWNTLGTM
jgi:hypothetical protein